MKRTVEPEWLDELPDDDAAAIASRRDIARLNRIMGNGRILENLLPQKIAGRTPQRIVELGAGDGKLMLSVARRLSGDWKSVQVVLVDRKNAVSTETRSQIESLGWKMETAVADVFDWLKKSEAKSDLIVANLFLHHFEEKSLMRLLALAAARTDVFAACEPKRARLPLAFSRMTGFIGCNAVTRHDAVTSVRAGFADNELSALWPAKMGWRLQERSAGWFTHAFLAERNGTP
jgi:hypothetical protein